MAAREKAVKPARHPGSPAREVAAAIGRFDPEVARLVRGARSLLRRRFATANELVYDNYNALAIGWGATERPSDVIVSLAVYPRGVNLYFMHGAALKDPRGLLQGEGSQGRFLRLSDPEDLEKAPVAALLNAATLAAKTPLPKSGRGRTLIKSVSAKQRARRPG